MELFSLSGKESAITYCVVRLSDFMSENLKGRGTPARFGRKAGVSSGTVSKWARGDMESAPNFENCIRIANYFRLPPPQVFEMAERPDYTKLFGELFPDYEGVKPEPDPGTVLCEQHARLLKMADELLHDPSWENGIKTNIIGLHAAMTGAPPDLGAERKLPPKPRKSSSG
jgi:transcriptional regulator with XRE-family HTH domain